jgi:molecular chaperone GrpE
VTYDDNGSTVPMDEDEGLEGLTDEDIEFVATNESGVVEDDDAPLAPGAPAGADAARERDEYKDKYVRLYADFDNFRKRVAKDKEDLVKYANETLLYDLLPSIDHLEIALKHAGDAATGPLGQGVRMTLREMQRTLEKAGLTRIDATEGVEFDPEIHHAMSQAERADMNEGRVVDELRAGFMYRGKVLRAAMVSVSKQPEADATDTTE